MSDLIRRKDVVEALYQAIQTTLTGTFTDSMSLAIAMAKNIPSAEPDRKFLEIIAEYPKVCTYPEYEGKPYYSIKYEENGETIVGFGTYKLEVLSQYLREYFISLAEPERNKGKCTKINCPIQMNYISNDCDIKTCPYRTEHRSGKWKNIAFFTRECSECGAQFHELEYDNFCPNCGANMRGNNETNKN